VQAETIYTAIGTAAAVISVVVTVGWRILDKIDKLSQRMEKVEKDVAITKAILCMQGIIPKELISGDS
jgi:hypothetical protein